MVHLVVSEEVAAGLFTEDVVDRCHASLVRTPALVILNIRHTLDALRTKTAHIGTSRLLRETALPIHFVSFEENYTAAEARKIWNLIRNMMGANDPPMLYFN